MFNRTLSVALVAGSTVVSQVNGQDLSRTEVKSTKLAEGVFMLVGAGGNIGVSAGEDGVFLVDDQYAPLTPKIQAAVAAISSKPVRFVLNTHWHGDHTGGNENLGKAGALIVAHDNVRKRMSVEQFIEVFASRTPPSPKAALPVVTFNETVTFHLNGEEVHAFHVAQAHTDGDAIVHFRKSNIVHMGDLFFNGMYPFIDVSTGGSVDGMIGGVERVLAMIDGGTKIIPGHGPLADRMALQSYRDMLVVVRDRLKREIAAGKTLKAVVAAKPLADLDEKWGKGFLKPEQFLGIAYTALKAGK